MTGKTEVRLLLLPGYACTARIWEPVLPLLPGGVHVTSLDWPRGLTPGFRHIADFTDWLGTVAGPDDFTAVAAHSMGGMAALTLAARGRLNAPIILVESFIKPPGPFFRSLLTPGCAPAIETSVKAMLAAEGARYAPELRGELRGSDLSGSLGSIPARVSALYGDRGAGSGAVIKSLDWPKAVLDSVPVTAIPGSCHFPMLENPRATAAAIAEELGRAG